MLGVGIAALPATCGELVQGTLDGVRCLVSCPIDRSSLCEIAVQHGGGWDIPPHVPKTVSALQAALGHLGCAEWGGRLRLTSDLPRGRGYGSSTADVGAALYALGAALGRPLAADQVARLAVGVEPSDSTLFPGLALFAHRDATFHESLGPAPPLVVLVLDPGGQVDTLAFNQLDHRAGLERLASQHREAFSLLRQGLENGDWRAVGRAATLSAIAHQTILPNPLLDKVLGLAREIGALGVCRAHSGTLLGLLLDPVETGVQAVSAFVRGQLPARVTVTRHALVDGGPRIAGEMSCPAGCREV